MACAEFMWFRRGGGSLVTPSEGGIKVGVGFKISGQF